MMEREQKTWTTLEIKFIKENARFGTRNQVVNKFEMAIELNRSEKSIDNAIGKLRKNGSFPQAIVPHISSHVWTEDEVDFLVNNIEYDVINRTSNLEFLATSLNLSKQTIKAKIHKLRREGILEYVSVSSTEKSYERYSEDAIKIVINAYRRQMSTIDIAKVLKRSPVGIQKLAARLKEEGRLSCKANEIYSEKEINYLINNIKLDKHGYVCNFDELCHSLNRSVSSVRNKLAHLRREGYIESTADRTKTSVRAEKAYKEYNDLRFAKYKCGKRKEYAKN